MSHQTSIAGALPPILGGTLALLLLLTACSGPPSPVLTAPTEVYASPTPPPVVSEDEISHPERWTLLPGELAVQHLAGEDARSEDIPAPPVGPVYVMYAVCTGGSVMTVETKGVTGLGDASWTVECNSAPNRRQVHTAEDTRTQNIRIVTEGSGTWGFLLANTAGE